MSVRSLAIGKAYLSAVTITDIFFGILPTRWRRKPVGIDTERNCVTATLCITPTFVLFFRAIGEVVRRRKWFTPASNYITRCRAPLLARAQSEINE